MACVRPTAGAIDFCFLDILLQRQSTFCATGEMKTDFRCKAEISGHFFVAPRSGPTAIVASAAAALSLGYPYGGIPVLLASTGIATDDRIETIMSSVVIHVGRCRLPFRGRLAVSIRCGDPVQATELLVAEARNVAAK